MILCSKATGKQVAYQVWLKGYSLQTLGLHYLESIVHLSPIYHNFQSASSVFLKLINNHREHNSCLSEVQRIYMYMVS